VGEPATAVLSAQRLPPEIVEEVAAVPFAIAVLVIVVGLLRMFSSGRAGPSELTASLSLGLEFFLAAGLIRLAAIDDFGALGIVAAIIALRKVIGFGVSLAVRGVSSSPPGDIRA
jgi:uncharacterized membrane protein